MKTLSCLPLFYLCFLACLPSFAQSTNKKPLSPKPPVVVLPKRIVMSAKEIFTKYHNSMFTIKTDKGQGTGFVYTPETIRTCFHVVDGAKTVKAVSTTGKEFDLNNVIDLHLKADCVTMLSRQHIEAEGFPLAPAFELAVGDPLYVIGSLEGLEQTLTEGILSGLRTVGGVEYLQLSAAVSPGSSGSPVFNKYGEIVGMVVSTLKEGQQLNFAISINTLIGKSDFGIPIEMISKQSGKDAVALDAIPNDNLVAQTMRLLQEHKYARLGAAPDFSINVWLSGALGVETLTKDTVNGWIEAELARSAPTAKIIKQEEQKKQIEKPGLMELLRVFDFMTRQLSVSIITMYDNVSHITTYSVSASFLRNGILLSGSNVVYAWMDTTAGYYGSTHSADENIRNAVQQLVKRFADQWSIDNKPEHN